MKLLIQKDLRFEVKFAPGCSEDFLDSEQEYFAELARIAKLYSLGYKAAVTDEKAFFEIQAQKVTLDEVAMNHFFHDFLTELFDIEVEYAALGGEGCGFAMELTKATQSAHYDGAPEPGLANENACTAPLAMNPDDVKP